MSRVAPRGHRWVYSHQTTHPMRQRDPGLTARSIMKSALANLLVVLFSIALSLLAAEGLARTLLDPVDYLLPKLAPDKLLFHRIEGGTGGHDSWGFRNAKVPSTAEIVCIGDSVTYGVAAQAR